MEINAMTIERLGGCTYNPLEPNTPDIPEIDGVEIEAILFDGFGVCHHEGKYYLMSYAKLEDVKDDEQVRRTINEYRYGNRLPNDFEVTIDDLALTFGEFEECEHSEYVSYLIDGLVSNIEHLIVEDGKREVLSPDECATKLREIEKCPPKYLYYFTDRDDLVEQFDGEIYPVYDQTKRGEKNDGWICDVLLKDLLILEEQGVIRPDKDGMDLNEPYLVSEEHRATLLEARFEAIIFLKEK